MVMELLVKNHLKVLLVVIIFISSSETSMAQDLFSTLLNGKVETKKDYYPDGRLKKIANYRNGKMINSEMYYKSGKTMVKATFTQAGNDTYINFKMYWGTPDDQIEMKELSYPGLTEGLKKHFSHEELDLIKMNRCHNADGVSYEENFKNGLIKEGISKDYYCNGIIKYKDTYVNGELKSRKAYDEDGKLKFDQNY